MVLRSPVLVSFCCFFSILLLFISRAAADNLYVLMDDTSATPTKFYSGKLDATGALSKIREATDYMDSARPGYFGNLTRFKDGYAYLYSSKALQGKVALLVGDSLGNAKATALPAGMQPKTGVKFTSYFLQQTGDHILSLAADDSSSIYWIFLNSQTLDANFIEMVNNLPIFSEVRSIAYLPKINKVLVERSYKAPSPQGSPQGLPHLQLELYDIATTASSTLYDVQCPNNLSTLCMVTNLRTIDPNATVVSIPLLTMGLGGGTLTHFIYDSSNAFLAELTRYPVVNGNVFGDDAFTLSGRNGQTSNAYFFNFSSYFPLPGYDLIAKHAFGTSGARLNPAWYINTTNLRVIEFE